ncbi:GNAT family N-acetyltransferase [Ornithinimicrobium sp. F0845]|uniref:GNAT family N-acetyltransferase n=1 Tax=Ornithinimicrobium sp. F0845 TaxID=2926412 RepID=UPI001FF11F27|nr:GNAT family N-acetyltransferase [Ornithinimicrobium sp. F0845]
MRRPEALELAPRLAGIYGRAMRREAEPVDHFESTFRRCVGEYDGATVLVASRGEDTVGFLYGFDLQLGHWWPQQIEGPVRAAGHGHWLTEAFELVELQVTPEAQGLGVGSALLSRQLSEMPHQRALLATDPDGRARMLYRRIGFRDLVPDFVYAGTSYRATLMGWERRAS